ncbi:MAG: RNA polymerase sigma factor [Myxococcota bacterium]
MQDRVSDDDLVSKLKQGDEAAFEALYERYFPRIHAFVDRRLSNRADVEETVQEVFFNVFNSVETFRGEAPFAAWVFGLTRRTIASRFKKKRHATVPLDTEMEDVAAVPAVAPPIAPAVGPTPLELYEYQERLDRMDARAEQQLSEEQRHLFVLHHLRNQSIGDIARNLCKTEDAVKSNLYRARKILMAT